MNTEVKTNKLSIEIIKWLAVNILLAVSIFVNYFHSELCLSLRILIILPIIITAGYIAFITSKGREFISFFQESCIEIKKVIWPTRQKTLYTTLIVIVVTAVMSCILWSLDIFLVNMISFITSLRL